jgi:hypothetical protein
VIVLANRGDMDLGLATKVADVTLEGKFKEEPPKEKQEGKEKAEPVTLTQEQQAEFVGGFYSAELDVFYHVAVKDGKLEMRYRKGVFTLEPLGEDRFRVSQVGAITVQFRRDAGKRVVGFAITTGRIRNLRFDRAEVKLTK